MSGSDDPRRTEDLKASPLLVKAVQIPLVLSHFCDVDENNGHFIGQNRVVSPAPNRLRPKTPWFPEPSTTRKAKYGEESSDHHHAETSRSGDIGRSWIVKKGSRGHSERPYRRITRHLKKGERVRIVGLGILQVRKRAARMGRNPATGEPIQIKASKKVAFRASKELKEAI
jgi:DNA-binding protein HU-beta